MSLPPNRRSPTARLRARSTRRSCPSSTPLRRPRHAAWLRRGLVLVLLAAGLGATAAPAGAALQAYNEPTYTKTNGNNAFWYHWTTPYGSNGSGQGVYAQYLCFKTYRTPPPNGPQVLDETSNGSAGGPGSQNCTGWLAQSSTPVSGDYGAQPYQPNTVLQDGTRYDLCATGYYPSVVIYLIDPAGNSVCPWTIIDRNAPQVGVALAGGATTVRDAAIPIRIDYADSTSPPWAGTGGVASNWVCVGQSACTPGGAPRNDCSIPADPTSRSTSFGCTTTVPSDGRWYVCARTADSAIPDNASGTNQFANATSNNANLSGVACDDVVVDRAPPTVAVTADRTSITAGETVSFSASVSDATSGAPAPYTWDFGDGIGQSTGATPSHAYTQPGTYTVRFTARDVAGNESSATTTITVAAAAGSGGGTGSGGGSGTGGGTGTGGGSGSGGGTGGGSSAGSGSGAGGGSSAGSGGGAASGATGSGAATVTTAPAEKAVSSANGGGGTASVRAGTLRLVVPKRFTLTTKRRTLQLRATLGGAGRVELTLLRGKRAVARGAVRASAARTVGLGLKIPGATRAGTYSLRVVFRPTKGKAVTRTARIRIRRAAAPRALPLVGRPADR